MWDYVENSLERLPYMYIYIYNKHDLNPKPTPYGYLQTSGPEVDLKYRLSPKP